MSCNVTTPRVVKMGIDYGTVQLLSTSTIDAMYAQELSGKQIALDVQSFVNRTPMVNNFIIQTIHNYAEERIIALFSSAFSVTVVASILNKQAVQWELICFDREAFIVAEQAFPNATVHFISDDAQMPTSVAALHLQQQPMVLFGNNKLSPHYNMLLGTVGLYATPTMVYQTAIKSVALEQAYNGVLFFDTMSVDSYFVLNELQNNTVAFCISQEVADHLTKLLPHPTVVVQASKPTTLSLIESVLVYYNR